MAATKRANTEPTPALAALAVLEARIRELEQRDRDFLSEQLKLEGNEPEPPLTATREVAPGLEFVTRTIRSGKLSVVRPEDEPTSATLAIDAVAYLERDQIEPPSNQTPGQRLAAINRERRAIKAALALAHQRSFRLRIANEAELAGDIADRARTNIQKSAAAVRLLRELAQERERLREEYSMRTGLSLMIPAAHAFDRVVSVAHGGSDNAQSALEAARAAGLA